MNLKLVKLQALACGLLSFILAAEWGYGEFAGRRLQKSLQYAESNEEASVALPAIGAPKPAAEEYAEMVERPLFIQGRKPIVETDSADKAQNVDVGQIDDWLLIGVYNKDKRPMALFAKKNEAKKYQKIGSEQMISGWLLKEIQSDRVILEQAGQQKSVLLRKPRPDSKIPVRGKPAAAKPAPAPAPPAQPNDNNSENVTDDSETN